METLKNRIENIRKEILQRIETGDFELDKAYFCVDIKKPVIAIRVEDYEMGITINLEMDYFYQMWHDTEDTVIFPKSVPLVNTLRHIGQAIIFNTVNKED